MPREAFRSLGGWKSVFVALTSTIAGFILAGAIVYPAVFENRERINAIIAVDARHARVLDSLQHSGNAMQRRLDWIEVQTCAIRRGDDLSDGETPLPVTRRLNAELQERCRAAARRLANNP